MKFLLDTNFLVDIFALRIDMISELSKFGQPDLFALSSLFSEMEKVKGNQKKFTTLAEDFAESRCLIIENSDPADTALLKCAKKGYIVCTQDASLRKKIASLGLKSVAIRQKKYLEMV